VTLPFADADAVDFTRLAQGLDPEDVGAVMDDVLARGTAVVVAQGGRVLQYAGDSLLAVFGTRRFQRWACSATRTRCASRQRRSGGTRWSR
jgi:class 3 adenylate cyclase